MKKVKVITSIGIVALFIAFAITVKALPIEGISLNYSNDGDSEMIKAYGYNPDKFVEDNMNKVKIAGKIESIIKENYGEKYPSYYGGMYISDDSQNLIVQIVASNIPVTISKEYSIYDKIVNVDSAVKIEYVKNSYSDLKAVNDKIIQYLDSDQANKDVFDNFTANYVDEMNNSVVIELKNNSTEKQALFKKTIASNYSKITNSINDLNCITFKKGQTATPAVDVNPGKIISVHNDSKCSMGFRTKYNGKEGYVTAGHCFTGTSPSIVTGSVELWHFVNNQESDYAFVETKSSFNLTNKLEYGATGITTLRVPYSCPTLVTNMVVAKSGYRTGYTAGKLTSTSVNVSYKDAKGKITTINNLAQASLTVHCGDSGGPVFIPTKDSDGGPFTLGIVSGKDGDCTAASNVTYFSNINLLPWELQSNRY